MCYKNSLEKLTRYRLTTLHYQCKPDRLLSRKSNNELAVSSNKSINNIMRVGNRINSFLNGEWAKHVRKFGKKRGSKKRRVLAKIEIKQFLCERYQF